MGFHSTNPGAKNSVTDNLEALVKCKQGCEFWVPFDRRWEGRDKGPQAEIAIGRCRTCPTGKDVMTYTGKKRWKKI